MNAETERPEPQRHTFSITVDIDPRWVDYVTQHDDIFGPTYYAGYWAKAMAHELVLGWLVAERDEQGRYPGKTETERVEALWRSGIDLPPRWYRLGPAAAIRMWEEGVKKWGVGWYDAPVHDGSGEDVLLQITLLGEVRYG